MAKKARVLIANRGEIALRIQRACQKIGIPSVITVSEADRKSYFAEAAESAAFLSGFSAKDSYLNISSILQAAKKHRCNYIHPGYGFLSENSNFAAATAKAGLIFVGPSARCIAELGDKAKARRIASICKAPVTPGTSAELSDSGLLKAAEKLKLPLLIKAVSGGGGRGMRIIRDLDELKDALSMARSEAERNFLDSRIYLERYIETPRHVEVQIAGDNFGNVVHFGTRDCSTQRRHQKLIEEAPAPLLKPALREKLHSAAVRIAKRVKYNSLGTAEFLVSGDEFFFLEMNTRIQVEHPVTEEISGVDLVELQLKIAFGEKLPLKQKNIRFRGHSIEFRINAEDPDEQFKPLSGKITKIHHPKAKDLRIETGFKAGDEITPYYDGLISKLIVTGPDRKSTLKRAEKLLSHVEYEGVKTTLSFHRALLKNPLFVKAPLDTNYLSRAASAKLKRVDEVEYHSESFRFSYKILVYLMENGDFVLVPSTTSGKIAQEANCRRAASIELGLKALKRDVLESIEPGKIFR